MAEEADESSIRWLISYADFMMQLVCLFILMYSVSNIEVEKAREIAKGYREAKGLGPPKVPIVVEPTKGPFITLVKVKMEEIERGVVRYGSAVSEKIKFQNVEGGVRVFLEGVTMFEEGEYVLTKDAEIIFDAVRAILVSLPNYVNVIGYTSASARDTKDGDHFLLSLYRAREVGKFLAKDFDPERLSIFGRGANEPRANEQDPRRREQAGAVNRRVELLIVGLEIEFAKAK
jgi:chemotaxis protein MotB